MSARVDTAALKAELVAKYGEPQRARIDRGVDQVLAQWRPADGDLAAFLHAQDGAGGGSVVADGGENALGGEFDGDGFDAEGDVGFGLVWIRGGGGWSHRHGGLGLLRAEQRASGCGLDQGQAAELEEMAAVHEVCLALLALSKIVSRWHTSGKAGE